MKIVSGARYTVDVCLYSLAHHDLESALINLLKNGKKVRVVVGERMENEETESVKRLRCEGQYYISLLNMLLF